MGAGFAFPLFNGFAFPLLPQKSVTVLFLVLLATADVSQVGSIL